MVRPSRIVFDPHRPEFSAALGVSCELYRGRSASPGESQLFLLALSNRPWISKAFRDVWQPL
jgi:hypothetical protein